MPLPGIWVLETRESIIIGAVRCILGWVGQQYHRSTVQRRFWSLCKLHGVHEKQAWKHPGDKQTHLSPIHQHPIYLLSPGGMPRQHSRLAMMEIILAMPDIGQLQNVIWKSHSQPSMEQLSSMLPGLVSLSNVYTLSNTFGPATVSRQGVRITRWGEHIEEKAEDICDAVYSGHDSG